MLTLLSDDTLGTTDRKPVQILNCSRGSSDSLGDQIKEDHLAAIQGHGLALTARSYQGHK